MRLFRLAIPFLALALLAGCRHTPMRFHTLVPPPGSAPAPSVENGAFDLVTLSLPAGVDLPQLVLRGGVGEMQLLEQHQWIAPLRDELRQALSQALAERLGWVDVQRMPRPAGLAVAQVRVDVRRLELVPGEAARLAALWSVERPGASPRVCAFSHRQPVGPGVDAAVEGLQQGVAVLAEALATALRTPESSCPAPAAQ